ncbi:MAG: TIGR00296 family protein [Candidatus Bathyarchaeota archaeon]|nr:TIGR00296 family protein [Candidatus Bathyarchaeota archaeon]
MAKQLSFELDPEEGAFLVGFARGSIEAALGGGEPPSLGDVSEKLRTDCGVFVTLNKVSGPTHSLRGCIGFPYPVMPLVDAVSEAAVSAALRDPRFQPVSLEEMGSVAVEVSVLTPPEKIVVESPGEYPDHVRVGRDGLIVDRGSNRGLLLPQVAVDWGWSAEEFLTQCCIKAYLPPDSWLTPGTEIFRFRAIIFAEEQPRGRVVRVELKDSC